jgi:hypothetical protein
MFNQYALSKFYFCVFNFSRNVEYRVDTFLFFIVKYTWWRNLKHEVGLVVWPFSKIFVHVVYIKYKLSLLFYNNEYIGCNKTCSKFSPTCSNCFVTLAHVIYLLPQRSKFIIMLTCLKGIVSKLTIKFWMCQKVAKWKITTKIYLQILQNDYKHTGYDNDYKIDKAISF